MNEALEELDVLVPIAASFKRKLMGVAVAARLIFVGGELFVMVREGSSFSLTKQGREGPEVVVGEERMRRGVYCDGERALSLKNGGGGWVPNAVQG